MKHSARRRKALRSCTLFLGILLAAGGPASVAAQSSKVEQRVIFMLDISASMPKERPGMTFADEVGKAREKSRKILEQLQGRTDVTISFWTFGDKDCHAYAASHTGTVPEADCLNLFDRASTELAPEEAVGRLGEYFSPAKERYWNRHTYIAYSIFRMVQRTMDLGEDFTPRDDIPLDASQLVIFVFTDGLEDNRPGFDNAPFAAWVERQNNTLQLVWSRWKLFATGDERTIQDECFSPERMGQTSYSVHFGAPTTAGLFNPSAAPPDGQVKLAVPPYVRLRPSLIRCETRLGDEQRELEPCSPENQASRELRQAEAELKVQAEVEWADSRLDRATEGWSVLAPPLPAGDGVFSRRGVLMLPVVGPATLTLPGFDIAEGGYPVRFIRRSLCDELRRAYPGTEFILPEDEEGKLLRLGTYHVENRPTHNFYVTDQEGVAPDAGLADLVPNRWHYHPRQSRTFVVTGPADVVADVEYSLSVFHGRGAGRTAVTDASQLAVLEADGTSGSSVQVAAGEEVRLSIPAQPQSGLGSALGRGFRWPHAGEHELQLCVRPRVTPQTDEPFSAMVVCSDCSREEDRKRQDELCMPLSLNVHERPLSWWWWMSIATATVVLTWALWRWASRPQFPPGLRIGNLRNDPDLRSAHARGISGRIALFRRRPGFVDLQPGGRTTFSRNAFLDATGKGGGTRNILGVAPSRWGTKQMLLWCVSTATHGNRETAVRVTGEVAPLAPTKHDLLPGRKDRKVPLRYDRIRRSTLEVILEKDTGGRTETLERYLIQINK